LIERVLSDGEARQMLLLLRPRDCRSGRTSVNGDANNIGLAHKNVALVLSLSRCCFLGQLDLASNFKEEKGVLYYKESQLQVTASTSAG